MRSHESNPESGRRSAYGIIVVAFMASRLTLAAVGLLALAAIGGQSPGLGSLPDLFVRWDSGWYLSVVENGYSAVEGGHPGQTNFAFFPVYPLLVGAFRKALGWTSVGAALFVSNAAFLAALFLVYEYGRVLGAGFRAAVLAPVLICFVPQSFVFSAVYTESTFLCLLAAAMLAMRRRAYLTSGLSAGVLSGVRSLGVLFAFYALAVLVRRDGVGGVLRFWKEPKRFLAPALAPAGLVAFWWFSFWRTGDAFAQAHTAKWGWGWSADWPWTMIASVLRYGQPHDKFWVVCSLTAFALSLLLLRYRYFEEFVFCALAFLLVWSGGIPNSLLRYSIVLFPIYIGVARLLEPRPLLTGVVLGALATVNGMLMAAWALNRLIAI